MLDENEFFNNKHMIKKGYNMYLEVPDTFAFMGWPPQTPLKV